MRPLPPLSKSVKKATSDGLVAVPTDAWVVGGKVVASGHHVASGITDLAVTKDGGKGRVTTAIRVGADCFGYDPCYEGGSNGGAHGGRGWREGGSDGARCHGRLR
jgi:hypothetical protein